MSVRRSSVPRSIEAAQAELRRSEQLLSSVLRSAPDYIAKLDRSGRIIFVNHVVPWLKTDQVVGQPVYRFVPRDQHAVWRRSLSQAFRTGAPVEFESLARPAKEGRHVFNNRVAPVFDGNRVEAVVLCSRDVTLHRRLEESVERSQALLSSTLTNVPDVVFVLDAKQRIRFINKVASGCAEDVFGKAMSSIVAPGERPLWARHFREAVSSAQPRSFETSHRLPSGEVSWYSHRLTPVHSRGKLDSVVVVCTDISERKNLELKLKESERYWRSMLEQMPHFIAVMDRRGRFQYVNRYAEGLGPKDVLGKPLYPFLHPSSRGDVRRGLAAVFSSGKPVRLRTRGVGERGGMAWYDNLMGPLKRGGRVEAVVSVAVDISKEMETAARFRAVFDSSRDAIDYIGMDGTYHEVNPAFERLTGFTRRELLELRRIYDLTPREFRHLDEEAMRRLIRTGQPVEFEKEYLRKDGSRVPVNVTAFGVRGASGKVEGFSAIIKDITERRRLERELVEAGAREQGKLGQDLHDTLGQTVTGLSLLAKSLRGSLERSGAPEAVQAARLVELSALAARQARSLAKGLLPKELQAAGLGEALRQLGTNVEDLFQVRCDVDLPPGPIPVDQASAVQLYRIAQEALHNAAKHARSRTGIRLSLSVSRKGIRLEVADKGVGLPEPAGRGKGLGMGIMEHRARMLGGSLIVRRRPSGGTVVRCVCPLPGLYRKAEDVLE